ncbi:MAG: trypsin-like peptidase domain-containing protein [Candidatus Paceibacterota bacterium]
MKSPIIEVAKKACPAVITIVISKDLPKVEGFYMLPFGEKEYIMPKIKDGKTEMQKIGGGSAFIVSPDGYVLTSCHVVEDNEAEYTALLEPSEKYIARVLARDPINDVAILKIEEKNLPYLELGDSDKVELGEDVVAIGNALGEFHDTLSSGIVSGLSRFIRPFNNFSGQTENLRGLIQTDAAINPGNSGGPLVNMKSEVIGINTAAIVGAQNMGFAIPINYAKKDLKEVMMYGKMKVPFLGIKYIIINKEIAEKNNLPVDYGALIIRERLGDPAVIKNSAAQKAGLKEFDIVLNIGEEKIDVDNPLSRIISNYNIGDKAELLFLRDGKKIKTKIELKEKI